MGPLEVSVSSSASGTMAMPQKRRPLLGIASAKRTTCTIQTHLPAVLMACLVVSDRCMYHTST